MSLVVATKAEALQHVRSRLRHADVPPFLFWSVDDWRRWRDPIVAACMAAFRGANVAVRSATRDEDGPAGGFAGHYRTELDVPSDPMALARAVDRVVAGYPRDGRVHHVLVQTMVRAVRRSGVVVTRDPASGAPYYVIELAEGPRTDVVTGGRGEATRVGIHHGAHPAAVERAGFGALVRAVRAVEAVRGGRSALEIELAERTDGTIALLQVRPSSAPPGTGVRRDRRVGGALAGLARKVERIGQPRRGIAGASTVLGLMPDWNPAELIGSHPMPLAAACFGALISDRTWHEARAAMGYCHVPATPLVHMIAGRPYVDVRASFNSFVPAGLPQRTRTALVDAWLARLRAHPELHDRVELEVAATVFDFELARGEGSEHAPSSRGGAESMNSRAESSHGSAESSNGGAVSSNSRAEWPNGGALPSHDRDRAAWLAALRALTVRAIDLRPGASLSSALRTVAELATAEPAGTAVALADVLRGLECCRVGGARPFAVIARHAFMAERLLRTLVTRGALAPERLVALRRALATVAGRCAGDAAQVARGTLPLARFLATYGHLRPGTFDVTSLPYALRDPAIWMQGTAPPEPPAPFVLRPSERAAVERLLRAAGFAGGDGATAGCGATADGFFAWVRAAIVGREDAKLWFARGLSAFLEDLAGWGARHGLARDDLACLTIADLRRAATIAGGDVVRLRARIAAARTRRRHERELRLGPVLRDGGDLAIVYEPPVLPTFITARTVMAVPVRIDGRRLAHADVTGKIVCIESADPGFDWILARGIAGLVTRFGGANSHMAVRCLELGIAAALGVGEGIFERVCRAGLIELRCGEGLIRDGAPAGVLAGTPCAP